MNFDDRLKNHLTAQNNELIITPEGPDAVQARSARRKRQRTTAGMLSVVAIALAVGIAALGLGNGDAVDFATEGEAEAPTTTSAPVDQTENVAVAASADVDSSLPDPGAALRLSPISNDGAPGGYNLYTSGTSNGVYFVVSTAPGLRWDDLPDGEYGRPDTIYSFDGSSWSNQASSTGDRFVSSIQSAPNGVIYAVSTGTETSAGLSIGSSTNSGKEWDWTAIDLTPVFGADTSTWPVYSVTQAVNGDQRLVVVSTSGNVDSEAAFTLANANGAGIDSIDQVFVANSVGIRWFESAKPVDRANLSCSALSGQISQELWTESEHLEPDFDFGEELSADEQARVDDWVADSEALSAKIQQQVLDAVQETGRCDAYVACSVELFARQAELDDRISTVFPDQSEREYVEPSEEQREQADAIYEKHDSELQAWLTSSGCGDEVGLFGEGVLPPEQYRTWEELGATVPEAWQPTQRAFLIADATVSDLGDPFATDGYIVAVEHDGSAWTVAMDTTIYGESGPAALTPTHVQYASVDGVTWTSTEIPEFQYDRKQLRDGSSFGIDYQEDRSSILRSSPDGSVVAFELVDLAPDLDTEGYHLSNVSTGEYGVVAWATRWSERTSMVDSILLYSPDGQDWGATDIPDADISHVVVGDDGVIVFSNAYDRKPGEPQSVFFATAQN